MVDADFTENGYIRYGAILMCRNCGNRATLKNPALQKSDIAMIVDIPTQGLNREQIDAQLKQTIHAFHVEATRRYAALGYSLKSVQVFENDPGKCTILTELVSSTEVLRLRGLLSALWNQIAWEGSGSSPSSPANK